MYNEAWDKAENFMEKELGYSMREAREVRDLIVDYSKKFEAEEFFNSDGFSRIIKESKTTKLSKIYLAEMCVQLDYLIDNIDIDQVIKTHFMNNRKVNNLKKEIEYAKALWNLIKYSILPLEVFWAMEQEVENGMILTEKEEELYYYMVKVAQAYLRETSNLTEYISYSKIKEQEDNSEFSI